MCLHTYTYTYICTRVCIYIHIQTYIRINLHPINQPLTHLRADGWVSGGADSPTHSHICLCICARVCIHAHEPEHSLYGRIWHYIYMYMYIYTHPPPPYLPLTHPIHTPMLPTTFSHMCLCESACVCMHAHEPEHGLYGKS